MKVSKAKSEVVTSLIMSGHLGNVSLPVDSILLVPVDLSFEVYKDYKENVKSMAITSQMTM